MMVLIIYKRCDGLEACERRQGNGDTTRGEGSQRVVSTASLDVLKGASGGGAPFALGGGREEKRRLFLAQPFVAAVRAFAARPVAGDLGVETLRGGLHLLELRDQFRALLFQNLKAGGGGVLAFLEQRHVLHERLDLYARFAHAADELHPAAVVFGEVADAVGQPGDVGDEPDALVVANGVDRDSVAFRDFGDLYSTPPSRSWGSPFILLSTYRAAQPIANAYIERFTMLGRHEEPQAALELAGGRAPSKPRIP